MRYEVERSNRTFMELKQVTQEELLHHSVF